MSFRTFIEEQGDAERVLALVNRSQPEQLQSMLEGAFERQPVDVEDVVASEYPEDTVLLLDAERTVIARSPLSEVADSLLFTNSDTYITGTTNLEEAELPDVLSGLEDVVFRLRGYPQSHKEKLLLIAVSRHIERVAFYRNGGTLRSSFQKLSRINDEVGTQRVYQRLAASGVDVHVYGMPNGDDALEGLDLTVHASDAEEYRRSWFVVHRPPKPAEQTGIALLALQDESGVWDGFFTSRAETVQAIDTYIQREL